jgi:hypothetical protein
MMLNDKERTGTKAALEEGQLYVGTNTDAADTGITGTTGLTYGERLLS